MTAVNASLSEPLGVPPGRELAVRALQGGANCSQQRVSDLLHVSRRTIGRMAEADLTTALQDPQVFDVARTCLAETASRGSTVEERAAAGAWLEDAARDEQPVQRKHAARRPVARRPKAVHRSSRNGTPRNGAGVHGNGVATPTTIPPPLPPVDALRRELQRILHRSALGAYVLAAEKRDGETLTMGDALADLLADITEAARTMGTLLECCGEPAR